MRAFNPTPTIPVLKFLPDEDFDKALSSPQRARLFVGMGRDGDRFAICRGNFTAIVVPIAWFKLLAPLAHDDYEVIDCGNAVRVGSRQVTAVALLDVFARER